MKSKIVLVYKKVRALFPSKLPVGVAAFEEWADSFAELYTLPTDHKDSIRFVLATAIMNLGPQTAYKSKHYFFLTLSAGCAKQIAGSIFYEIKQRQKEVERLAALGIQHVEVQ